MTRRIRHVAVVIGMMGAWAAGWIPGLTDVDIVPRVQAEDGAAPAATLEQYCRSWARNAMMGASVERRGGLRTITYIAKISCATCSNTMSRATTPIC